MTRYYGKRSLQTALNDSFDYERKLRKEIEQLREQVERYRKKVSLMSEWIQEQQGLTEQEVCDAVDKHLEKSNV